MIEIDQLRPAVAQDDTRDLCNGKADHRVDRLPRQVAAATGRAGGEPGEDHDLLRWDNRFQFVHAIDGLVGRAERAVAPQFRRIVSTARSSAAATPSMATTACRTTLMTPRGC